MFWKNIFLILLCLSQLPSCQAQEKDSKDRIDNEKSEMDNRISAEEQNTDLENLKKFLLGHLEVTVPPEKPLMPPKSASQLSLNITLISVAKKEETKELDLNQEEEKMEQEEVQKSHMDEEEEKEEQKKEEDQKKDTDLIDEKKDDLITKENITEAARPSPSPTTAPADDNLSYILSRLSGIESSIHRLNVQFYGLDVKVSQMYQSLSKIRNRLNEAEDAITTVSEMNHRNQRQIGQIEGCMKGKRYIRKCYLIFQHFEDYDTAQKLCYNRGGNLAMPIDQQEFAAVAQYVHDAFFPFNWPVWIGINDRRSDGLYLFENGYRVSYFNWYKDHLVTQPNGGDLENCVSISSDDGKWWDNDCSRRMYYVCEY